MPEIVLPPLPELPGDTGDLLVRLCELAAPTGGELPRAEFMREWLDAAKEGCAELDEDHNLLVDLSGGGPAWLLDAHIDTVFPDPRPIVERKGGRWYGPGIYDNGAACALLMLLARELLLAGCRVPILISFSTGEEGQGDLRGIRGVVKRHSRSIKGAFVFDTHLHHVTTAAVGSTRYRTVWSGPGGHSWGHFGQSPSAVDALCEWVAALRRLMPWKAGYLSYNVGLLSGGTAINVIAAKAEADLDLRSTDPDALRKALDLSRSEALKTANRSGVTVEFVSLGDRPAATISPDWEGLAILEKIHRKLGIPLSPQADSTNANALLEAGIPATCTGLSIGGNIHTKEEWLDPASLISGWKKLQQLCRSLT